MIIYLRNSRYSLEKKTQGRQEINAKQVAIRSKENRKIEKEIQNRTKWLKIMEISNHAVLLRCQFV